jgi:hypothetical protein
MRRSSIGENLPISCAEKIFPQLAEQISELAYVAPDELSDLEVHKAACAVNVALADYNPDLPQVELPFIDHRIIKSRMYWQSEIRRHKEEEIAALKKIREEKSTHNTVDNKELEES